MPSEVIISQLELVISFDFLVENGKSEISLGCGYGLENWMKNKIEADFERWADGKNLNSSVVAMVEKEIEMKYQTSFDNLKHVNGTTTCMKRIDIQFKSKVTNYTFAKETFEVK